MVPSYNDNALPKQEDYYKSITYCGFSGFKIDNDIELALYEPRYSNFEKLFKKIDNEYFDIETNNILIKEIDCDGCSPLGVTVAFHKSDSLRERPLAILSYRSDIIDELLNESLIDFSNFSFDNLSKKQLVRIAPVVFGILHELAHVRSGHYRNYKQKNETRKENEIAADKFAVKKISEIYGNTSPDILLNVFQSSLFIVNNSANDIYQPKEKRKSYSHDEYYKLIHQKDIIIDRDGLNYYNYNLFNTIPNRNLYTFGVDTTNRLFLFIDNTYGNINDVRYIYELKDRYADEIENERRLLKGQTRISELRSFELREATTAIVGDTNLIHTRLYGTNEEIIADSILYEIRAIDSIILPNSRVTDSRVISYKPTKLELDSLVKEAIVNGLDSSIINGETYRITDFNDRRFHLEGVALSRPSGIKKYYIYYLLHTKKLLISNGDSIILGQEFLNSNEVLFPEAYYSLRPHDIGRNEKIYENKMYIDTVIVYDVSTHVDFLRVKNFVDIGSTVKDSTEYFRPQYRGVLPLIERKGNCYLSTSIKINSNTNFIGCLIGHFEN